MSKHTSGPWEVTEPNGRGMGIGIGSTQGYPYLPRAWLGHETRSEEQWANARLISAAPDLLEACEAALSMGDTKAVRQKLSAAYRKAMGEE